MKEALLISACLLGTNCKYNGGNNALPPEKLAALEERYRLVPVCPEQAGGLPTPRLPSECRGEQVVNRAGEDVTEAFRRGAELALETALREDCRLALLKERSPSCGSGRIYDGSFTATVIPGDGVTAEMLKKSGITVYSETEFEF
ncbi:MAG: DUF523 domain-containing protein [Oscillospiraceae bacterium]|jgi:uncharacterized protein YbbK (DUF523 family)|nr:DUF523 domain-containing protein [Oscillospiraceae bacterium]